MAITTEARRVVGYRACGAFDDNAALGNACSLFPARVATSLVAPETSWASAAVVGAHEIQLTPPLLEASYLQGKKTCAQHKRRLDRDHAFIDFLC